MTDKHTSDTETAEKVGVATCGSCHGELEADWKFCLACGFEIVDDPATDVLEQPTESVSDPIESVATCGSCHGELEADWKFCLACGAVVADNDSMDTLEISAAAEPAPIDNEDQAPEPNSEQADSVSTPASSKRRRILVLSGGVIALGVCIAAGVALWSLRSNTTVRIGATLVAASEKGDLYVGANGHQRVESWTHKALTAHGPTLLVKIDNKGSAPINLTRKTARIKSDGKALPIDRWNGFLTTDDRHDGTTTMRQDARLDPGESTVLVIEVKADVRKVDFQFVSLNKKKRSKLMTKKVKHEDRASDAKIASWKVDAANHDLDAVPGKDLHRWPGGVAISRLLPPSSLRVVRSGGEDSQSALLVSSKDATKTIQAFVDGWNPALTAVGLPLAKRVDPHLETILPDTPDRKTIVFRDPASGTDEDADEVLIEVLAVTSPAQEPTQQLLDRVLGEKRSSNTTAEEESVEDGWIDSAFYGTARAWVLPFTLVRVSWNLRDELVIPSSKEVNEHGTADLLKFASFDLDDGCFGNKGNVTGKPSTIKLGGVKYAARPIARHSMAQCGDGDDPYEASGEYEFSIPRPKHTQRFTFSATAGVEESVVKAQFGSSAVFSMTVDGDYGICDDISTPFRRPQRWTCSFIVDPGGGDDKFTIHVSQTVNYKSYETGDGLWAGLLDPKLTY